MFNTKKDKILDENSNLFDRGGEVVEILYRSIYSPIPDNFKIEKLKNTNRVVLHGYSCPRCKNNVMMCHTKDPKNGLKLICFCVTYECLQDDAFVTLEKGKETWIAELAKMLKRDKGWKEEGKNKLVRE